MDLPSLAALAPCDVGGKPSGKPGGKSDVQSAVQSAVAKRNSTKDNSTKEKLVQILRAAVLFDCGQARSDLKEAYDAYLKAVENEQRLTEEAMKYAELRQVAIDASKVTRNKAQKYVEEFDRIARNAPPEEECLHSSFYTHYLALKKVYQL